MYNDVDDAYSARQFVVINRHGAQWNKNKSARFSADVQRYSPPNHERYLYDGDYPDRKPRRWIPFKCSRGRFVANRFSMANSQGLFGSVHYDAILERKVIEHHTSIVAL